MTGCVVFACLDDIRFLKAGLSRCVLYQQIRRKVEEFLCPFLQQIKMIVGLNCLLPLYLWNKFKSGGETTFDCLNGLYVFVQSTYLGCFLLDGHEVQIRDVDHVRSSHHCQHPVLHLPSQGADIQQLPQLGFLRMQQPQKRLIKRITVKKLRLQPPRDCDTALKSK